MLQPVVASPFTGPLTLGFDPDRFQTEPPACYRASWATPTGLTPAGDDELANTTISYPYFIASPPVLLDALHSL